MYTITKVAIHKGTNLKVEYTKQLPDGVNVVKETCKQNIHEDLVNAFGQLDDHLTHLTQQRNSEGALANVECHCSAYELNINDENGDTVKLIGSRHMDVTHKTLELVSPPQNLSDMGVDVYEYEKRDELRSALDNLDAEVRAYMFEGKHAPEIVQAELFDDEELSSSKAKKKSSKKKDVSKAEIIETENDDIDNELS